MSRAVSVLGLLLAANGIGSLASAASSSAPTVHTLLERTATIVSAAMHRDELLVVSEREVTWYRMTNGVPRSLARYRGAPHDRFLHGDWIDLDHDGTLEAVVTNLRQDRLTSFILQARPAAGFQVIADHLPWYLRVVTLPWGGDRGDVIGPVLVGQRRGAHQAFLGEIVRMDWRQDRLVPGPAISLPPRLALYDFERFTNGKVVGVRSGGQPMMWRREGGRWRITGRWSAAWAGLSARWVPPAREFRGGTIGTPVLLGLPPVRLAGGWVAVTQRPFWRQVIGRVPYWREWRIGRFPLGRYAMGQPSWERQDDGAVAELRLLNAESVLLVIQQGRADPLDSTGARSRIVRFDFPRSL